MKKLCILAAGIGSRNDNISGLHKALLPLENRPVISHILDKLNDDIEIVIALGYKSEQIKSYMELVHSDRNITYIDVDNYDGVGAGPGYSLLCCKEKLKEPFVFTSVDTLVESDFDFMSIDENWLGVSSVDVNESINYCLVEGSKYLDKLYYGSGDTAYIGMAGVHDYNDFWNSLEKHKIIKDEYQVIHGFDGLPHMKLLNFVWYDTGNNESYAETKKVFSNDVVANKSDEAIFIDNNKVIKYFDDTQKVKMRVDRLNYLKNCPDIKVINDNMYVYDYIRGELLSNISDESLMRKFLDECQSSLWSTQQPSDTFFEDCKNMYEVKTKERIKSLSGSELDNISTINGIDVRPVEDMLNEIDWDWLITNGRPTHFHGDLQPENILYDEDNDKFVLIDWRQQFGSNLEVGDTYYDLAKLYHAILINGKCILNDMFSYTINSNTADLNFYSKSNLIFFKKIFLDFCSENGYIWGKVELLGLLQYLNICTLYDNFKDGRYGIFLFLYGKYLLAKFLLRST